MIIKLRILFKISFDSKSDYSLPQILLTTLFLKNFKINLGSLMSDYLTFFLKRLEKLICRGITSHELVKIKLAKLSRADHQKCRDMNLVSLKSFLLILNLA